MVMYLLSYVSGALKSAILLMGLNGSAEKMSLFDAYDIIDARVQSLVWVPQDGAIAPEQVIRAKKEILRLSYQGETLASVAIKVADNLEQEFLFGYPNELIELPQNLQNLGQIYQFKACQQMDGFSCGYWSTANAKVLDLLIGKDFLDMQVLNRDSSEMVQKLVHERVQKFENSRVPPARRDYMLLPNEINDIALFGNIDKHLNKYCKLNKQSFPSLVENFNVKTDKNLEKACKIVLQNKLHVVKLVDDQLIPCCFITDEDNHFEGASNIVKDVVDDLLKKDETYLVISGIVDKFITAANNTKILDAEQLANQKPLLKEIINMEYINKLKDMDKLENRTIESFLLRYYGSLINLRQFQEQYTIPSLSKVCADLDDYANKKLLTLINLKAAVIGYEKCNRLTDAAAAGSINSLVYLLALSNKFKDIIHENQNGAIHFVCHLPLHWILISVIYLANKGPVLAIFDSMNDAITIDLDLQEDQDFNDLSFLNEIEDETEKCKFFYTLYLYNLFIKDNDQHLQKRLDQECKKLESTEDGCRDDDLAKAVHASLEDLKNNHHSNVECDGDIHRLMEKGVFDACPGNKGKEKTRSKTRDSGDHTTLRNGIHQASPVVPCHADNVSGKDDKDGREKFN